jgi:hypothetical protein
MQASTKARSAGPQSSAGNTSGQDRTRRRLRWTFAAVSTVLLFLGWGIAHAEWSRASEERIENKTFNEMIKSAIEIRLAAAQSLFQLDLLILGGLWAILIARKDEFAIVLNERQEVIMFVICNVAFMLAIWNYYSYSIEVSEILYSQSTKEVNADFPGLFSPEISYKRYCQELFSLVGLTVALLTFLSGHQLKESKP